MLKKGEASFIWNARAVAKLVKGERLDRAVAIATVLFWLRDCEVDARRAVVDHEWFRDGREAVTAVGDRLNKPEFGDQVRAAIARADSEGMPGPDEVRRILERRLRKHGADAGTIAHEVTDRMQAAVDPANPYSHETLSRLVEERTATVRERASESSAVLEGQSNALAAELSGQCNEAERRLEGYRRAITPTQTTAFANVRREIWAAAICAATGAVGAMLFGATANILIVCFVTSGAAGFLGARRWQALHAAAEGEASIERPARIVRSLYRPAWETLARHLESVAAADARRFEVEIADAILEQVTAGDSDGRAKALCGCLEAEMTALPEGCFVEPHPGRVELYGRALAEVVASKQMTPPVTAAMRVAFLRMRCEPAAATAEALVQVAGDVLGELVLSELVEILREAGWGQKLTRWIDDLRAAASSVVGMQRGLRRERDLSPEVHSIGLPGGASDPCAPWMLQRFPGAAIVTGSDPEAIEFLYDISNLNAERLQTHCAGRDAYEATSKWQRYLMHFPRRRRGLVEIPGEDCRAAGD